MVRGLFAGSISSKRASATNLAGSNFSAADPSANRGTVPYSALTNDAFAPVIRINSDAVVWNT
jgi:hypothetical protein